MKLAFYGGQTAGIITLLALLAKKHQVLFVIPQDRHIEQIAKNFSLTVVSIEELHATDFIKKLKQSVDFLICCHGKKILKPELLHAVYCINVHPCLYKYKGAQPIKRLIADKNPKASVATHHMTEAVDQGEVIVEEFIKIKDIGLKTEAQVYAELYPLYCKAVLLTLDIIRSKNR